MNEFDINYIDDSIHSFEIKFKSESMKSNFKVFILKSVTTGNKHRFYSYEITDKINYLEKNIYSFIINDTIPLKISTLIRYQFKYVCISSKCRDYDYYNNESFRRRYYFDSAKSNIIKFSNDTLYDVHYSRFSFYSHSNSHQFGGSWNYNNFGLIDIVYEHKSEDIIYSDADPYIKGSMIDTIGYKFRHTHFKKLSLPVATFNAITDDKMILDSTQNGVTATKVKNFQKDDMIAFITEEKHKGIIHIKNLNPFTFDYIIKK